MTTKNAADSAAQTPIDTLRTTLAALETTVATAREQLTALEAVEELRIAEGTATVHAPRVDDVPSRALEVLRQRTATVRDLAEALGVSPVTASRAVGRLRRAGTVGNAGTGTEPRWTWRPGDDAPVEARHELVARLISERAMTLQEICEATGLSLNVARNCLNRLVGHWNQGKDGARFLQNLGNGRRGVWLLLPPEVSETMRQLAAGARS